MQIEKLKKAGKLEQYSKQREIASDKKRSAIFEQEIRKNEFRGEKFRRN